MPSSSSSSPSAEGRKDESVAADLPAIPAKFIAQKKELLFTDDFEGAEPAKVWHKVVPTFVVEKGTLGPP